MSSGKNLQYHLPSREKIKLPPLTEPGKEIQIDFFDKLHNKHVAGEPLILIGINRHSKWPVVRRCKSTQTKEFKKFSENSITFRGVPEKTKYDWGSAFISREYKMFRNIQKNEKEYSPPRLHTGMGAVERAIQTLKNLIFANLDVKIRLTESINQELRVMRFTIHTGLRVSPFEQHHRREPIPELINIIKGNQSYLSDWTTLNVSVPPKQTPIYVARNGKREVTDLMIMARKRKTPCCTSNRSPKSRPVKPVSENFQYPYTFPEKRNQKKLMNGNTKNNRELQ